jgi:hypothetical protein
MNIKEQIEKYIKVKSEDTFGFTKSQKRTLRQTIMAREELPVLRIEEKVIHGQKVAVRILPEGRARGCIEWPKKCNEKERHTTPSTPRLSQMRY